jgi:hypothetical protein
MPAKIRQGKRNKERGYETESRCKQDLIAEGYWVERFYASKGTWDLLAVSDTQTRLVQVKRSKAFIAKRSSVEHAYAEDITRMRLCPENPRTRRELWLWLDASPKHKWKAGWWKFLLEPDGHLSTFAGSPP